MKKKASPRVLTVDDGENMTRKSNTSHYGFVFSSDYRDWIATPKKQLKRFVERMKQDGL